MEVEDARPHDNSQQCLCRENLKKYTTLPLVGLALLLVTNAAFTVTQHRGQTSFNLCHNLTLPIETPFPLLYRAENVTDVKFRKKRSPRCLARHTLHLGEDIYLSVCGYRGSVRVDVGQFAGIVEREGILPTIGGIYLSPDQWKVLRKNVNFVDSVIKKLDHGP